MVVSRRECSLKKLRLKSIGACYHYGAYADHGTEQRKVMPFWDHGMDQCFPFCKQSCLAGQMKTISFDLIGRVLCLSESFSALSSQPLIRLGLNQVSISEMK